MLLKEIKLLGEIDEKPFTDAYDQIGQALRSGMASGERSVASTGRKRVTKAVSVDLTMRALVGLVLDSMKSIDLTNDEVRKVLNSSEKMKRASSAIANIDTNGDFLFTHFKENLKSVPHAAKIAKTKKIDVEQWVTDLDRIKTNVGKYHMSIATIITKNREAIIDSLMIEAKAEKFIDDIFKSLNSAHGEDLLDKKTLAKKDAQLEEAIEQYVAFLTSLKAELKTLSQIIKGDEKKVPPKEEPKVPPKVEPKKA